MKTKGMRTITFYSVKGGTGKSLAAAQLAVCLARAGKSVCILDFDFEAPGLLQKFSSIQDFSHWSSKGLAQYILNFAKKEKAEKLQNLGKMESITTQVITFKSGIQNQGAIHIFPAGDSLELSPGYWEVIIDEDWQKFMLLKTRLGMKFFIGLKTQIKNELKPTPQYLIIDSRSGVNELSGICTRLLADTVVILTANNKEGFTGTCQILKSFDRAREDGAYTPQDSYVVLSRMPQYYRDERDKIQWYTEEELEYAKKKAFDDICLMIKNKQKMYHIYSFSSEPRLEIKEELPIKFVGRPMNSQLSVDYLTFFCDLVPESGDYLLKLIPDAGEIRPYSLIELQGKLINPDDNAWNVALRQDTLCRTFENLYITILYGETKRGVAESEAIKTANRALWDAGFNAATTFSKFLISSWEAEKEEKQLARTLDSKLQQWCRFDSSVGFGRFEVTDIRDDVKSGKITLFSSFLTYNRFENDYNLCSFMTGYITRILQAILNMESVEVTHDLHTDCGQYKKTEPRVCVFRFKVDNQHDK